MLSITAPDRETTEPTGGTPPVTPQRVRDGHTLGLCLETAGMYLTGKCPHLDTDWSTVPQQDWPECRKLAVFADLDVEHYATVCPLAEWADSAVGAADMISIGQRTFTVTELPIDVEYWRSGDDVLLAPLPRPPAPVREGYGQATPVPASATT